MPVLGGNGGKELRVLTREEGGTGDSNALATRGEDGKTIADAFADPELLVWLNVTEDGQVVYHGLATLWELEARGTLDNLVVASLCLLGHQAHVGTDVTALDADEVAIHIIEGEQQAGSPEEAVLLASLATQDAILAQLGLGEVLAQHEEQPVARVVDGADALTVDDLATEATLTEEEVFGYAPQDGEVAKQELVEFTGKSYRFRHRYRCFRFIVLEDDVTLVCYPPAGFDKRKVEMLTNQVDWITTGSARPAAVGVARGTERHGGCPVIVEDAEASVVPDLQPEAFGNTNDGCCTNFVEITFFHYFFRLK